MRDAAFWGWMSSWQRGAPVAVRRTRTGGMHDCAIDRERRSTSNRPWYTRSPAPSNGWQSTTRWKAEPRSTPTGISEWTSSSRGEASAMRRHRRIETKRYFSTQRMPTRKWRATCVQAVPTGTGWLLPNPSRASAPTTLDQNKCPSTRAAIYKLATLAVESFGLLGRNVAT